MRKNNFRKSVLLIALLSLCLVAASCDQATGPSVTDGSTADTSHTEMTDNLLTEANTDEITTETGSDLRLELSLPYDTPAVELYQKLHEREIPHSEAVFYPAFRDDVVWEFSRYTTLPVTWEDLCYTVNDVGDKWQYTFWYTNEPAYVILNGCAVLSCRDSSGNVSYQISWEQTPYLVSGPYSAGDPLIDGYADFSNVDGYRVINRNALVAVLEDQIDLSKYQIQYAGIQLRDDMIFVPLLCDDRCFYADIGIDTSLNYIFRSLDEVDIDEISPHDFIIKYRAFGLSPLELMECGISHPLNPENLLSAYLDSDGIVDPSVYIGSEFLFEPYIRVRTDDTDVTYYLIHRGTGQSMAIADITEDIRYEDLYWGISPITNDDVIAMFEQVYAAKMQIFEYNELVYLGDCRMYSNFVYENQNQCAYIDFDGDGLDEALIQAGASGEYILHYDVIKKGIYATYFSPRDGYVYFANGEFCHNYDYDMTRYQITSFDGSMANISEVTYTDTEPQRVKPTWMDVEIKPSQDELEA